jgi:hypothetical protein
VIKITNMKRIPVLFFVIVLIASACTSTDKKNAITKDKYEKTKETLEETEKKNPLLFLTATSHDKKNLIGQKVINGTLTNSAKVASYKDVEIRILFYSKTKALLEEDVETIFEKIAPGTSVDFKKKYRAPMGTDSVGIRIMNAKVE